MSSQVQPQTEFRAPYEVIEAQIKFLQGEVLTIADAVISGSQNKAAKDLIKAAFSTKLRDFWDMYNSCGRYASGRGHQDAPEGRP